MRLRTSPSRSDERGIAILVALVAIIIIGALITGAFFAGRIELGSGRNTLWNTQAHEAAETGLTSAFSSWNSIWNDYDIGEDYVQPASLPVPGNSTLWYTQTVRRMEGGTYLILSRGDKLDRTGKVLARRVLGRLAKLHKPWMDIEAAVTSKGVTTVGGNATIDGRNTTPPGWPACSGDDAAGVRTNQTVVTLGSPDIYGSPPTRQLDSTVVDSIFVQPFQWLQPAATITLAPGTYNSMAPTVSGTPAACDVSNPMNWGEPRRDAGSVSECYSYRPIIYTPGNLHLTGGRGQGILLVGGDLRLQGGFEFVGIVLVLGEVTTTALGAKVTGAILAQNADISDATFFAGTPVVAYSKCAIEEALNAAGRGIPLSERSWIHVMGR